MSENNEQVVCNELTRYRFRRVPGGFLLRIDAEYRSDEHDFYFGDLENARASLEKLIVRGSIV